MWLKLNTSKYRLSDPAKLGLGMIVLGSGFIVLYLAQVRADTVGPVGPEWLAVVYALHTLGELMLSPVGLALVSRAAPHKIAGLLMGVWLLSSGVANYYRRQPRGHPRRQRHPAVPVPDRLVDRHGRAAAGDLADPQPHAARARSGRGNDAGEQSTVA